jgi:hypothetical protein
MKRGDFKPFRSRCTHSDTQRKAGTGSPGPGAVERRRRVPSAAASDQSELDRVEEKWCGKKLGVTGPNAKAAIAATAKAMAADRTKSRVTFYYLVAKELGKLDAVSVRGITLSPPWFRRSLPLCTLRPQGNR